jgi:modulator of FtsH protease HflK
MQQVFANTSKVMVDARGQGNLLYLPLDKLIQGAGAATASGVVDPAVNSQIIQQPRAGAAPSADTPPQLDRSLNSDNRAAREPSLRSRDRETR